MPPAEKLTERREVLHGLGEAVEASERTIGYSLLSALPWIGLTVEEQVDPRDPAIPCDDEVCACVGRRFSRFFSKVA